MRTFSSNAPQALILGGTRGLGRAIAIQALSKGIQPVIVGRSAEEAAADPALDGAVFVTADLTDPDDIVMVFEAGETARYVFWTAGKYHRGPLAEMTVDEIEHQLSIHLTPTLYLASLHRLRTTNPEKRPYDLVVVASVLSATPSMEQAMFTGLQAYKAQFARSFALELSRELPGSRTLIVHPWGMNTGFFDGTPLEKKAPSFLDVNACAKAVCSYVARLGDLRPEPIGDAAKRGVSAYEISLMKDDAGGLKVVEGSPQVPQR